MNSFRNSSVVPSDLLAAAFEKIPPAIPPCIILIFFRNPTIFFSWGISNDSTRHFSTDSRSFSRIKILIQGIEQKSSSDCFKNSFRNLSEIFPNSSSSSSSGIFRKSFMASLCNFLRNSFQNLCRNSFRSSSSYFVLDLFSKEFVKNHPVIRPSHFYIKSSRKLSRNSSTSSFWGFSGSSSGYSFKDYFTNSLSDLLRLFFRESINNISDGPSNFLQKLFLGISPNFPRKFSLNSLRYSSKGFSRNYAKNSQRKFSWYLTGNLPGTQDLLQELFLKFM